MFEDFASRGGADALGAEQVLDGEGDAGQQAVFAAGQRGISRCGVAPREFGGDGNEGVENGVEGLDRAEEGLGKVAG